MEKEFHLWLECWDKDWSHIRHYYEETLTLINNDCKIINTTQVILCTTDLFAKGYRIFVHGSNYETYEVKLGVNKRTGREIRMGHCLYRLILAGEFD